MAGSSGNESILKPFAHISIDWTVKNFCLTARNEGIRIYSPEFILKGDFLTKWRMILHIGGVTSSSATIPVSFILNRCPPATRKVFVNCELIVEAGSERFPDVENIFEFEKDDKRFMHFPSLKSILKNFKPFTTDTLHIQFNMIVRGDKDELYEAPRDGLFMLSEDLMNMFHRSMYHDITIVVDGKEIKGHKFMLNRIKLFRIMLSQNPDADRNILSLRGMSYENMHKLIQFIYTGNMIPVLNNPSLSMYKLIKAYSCDTLLCCYVPYLMSLKSTIELEDETDCIYWPINDFSHIKQGILSPLYKEFRSKVAWRMRLIPQFLSSNNYYISLFAEAFGYEKPHNACLEFGLLDAHNIVQYSKRVIKADDQNMGFQYFIDRHKLVSLSLWHDDDDTIRIAFRLRIPADTNASSRMDHFISPTVTLPKRASYEELSADMVLLLEGNECDLTIMVEDEIFHAHRSVMEARCTKLRRRLQDLEESQPLVIQDISAPIFRKFLDFIYRGIPIDRKDEDLVHVNIAAIAYGVKGM